MSAPVDPPETPAVEPVAAPQPGPWAADLATYFGENAEAIAAADRYMREVQQPRMTQLEMDSAPARELYKDLTENPQETLSYVVGQLYADEPELIEKFQAIWGDPEPEPVAVTDPPPADEPEWMKSAREREEAQRDADAVKAGEEAYAEVLAELREAHPDLTDADMDLIHPFMASAPDPEAAYNGFKAWDAQYAASRGIAQPEVAETVTPPPVLGSEAAVAAAPPVVKEYKTFDEAWEAYQDERAVSAPPVVGGV